MARAIEDVGLRLDLARRPPPLPLAGPTARAARGRPGRCWPALAAATARVELGPLVACTNFHNPAMLAKQADDDRRDQRRPVHPRPRRRLERDRVPGVRLPVRPPRRPLRGGVHDHPDAAAGGRDRLRRALLPGPRLRAAAARAATGRPAAPHRLERAADAADRRCRTSTPGTRGSRTRTTARTACARCARSSTRRAATSVATRPRSSARSPCSSGCPAAPAASQGDTPRRRPPPLEGSPEAIAEGLRAYAREGHRATSSSSSTRSRGARSRRSRRCWRSSTAS